MHDFAFIFAGFFVGIVVGLTGVGGGSLMTPILIFFFDVKPYLAVGTDLLFAAFTKMGGTLKLARARVIDWRVVLHLSAGSIPAALITLLILRLLGPANPQVQGLMTTTLGFALLLTAAATPRHWSLPLLFGAVIGTLVTLTSVGAGAIGVTVLMILYPLLPLPRIV
ncbi:sulfite exporter TauE/SafE family protein, partial [Rhodoferax sp.]|uniref:sulfite exporter TauE/SafE family protein n=1 Tax=Rhodoferax sp. TaxID=50421 RepID=UPI002724AACA